MKSLKDIKYDSNITAGALLFNEFHALQDHLGNDFIQFLRVEIELNNKVGIASLSARKRIFPQIKKRYESVPLEFWQEFISWNESTQRLGLFYVCLKTYPLIFDLHYEVARKKFLNGQNLGAYDIQMRIDELAANNDTVALWSESTLTKINTQYRRTLKEAGLYDDESEHLKSPNNIDPSFWMYLEMNNENWFKEACFI